MRTSGPARRGGIMAYPRMIDESTRREAFGGMASV
jgi:hypothetical protein